MKTVNRVVIVVVLLVLMALLTAVFILPHVLLTNVGNWMIRSGQFFNEIQPAWRLMGGVLLSVLFDLFVLFLVFLEVRPARKRFIRVQQVTGGMASISAESIVQQLVYKLDPMPGVIRVAPKIHAKGDKVQAAVDVDVEAGANVPGLATELMEAVKTVLAGSLGLQVYGQPEVRIKVAPAPTTTVKKSRSAIEEPLQPKPVAPTKKPQEGAGSPPVSNTEDRRA